MSIRCFVPSDKNANSLTNSDISHPFKLWTNGGTILPESRSPKRHSLLNTISKESNVISAMVVCHDHDITLGVGFPDSSRLLSLATVLLHYQLAYAMDSYLTAGYLCHKAFGQDL